MTGGIAELTMPSTEYRIKERGEAAHARAIPWRRFLRTRFARPFDDAGAFDRLIKAS